MAKYQITLWDSAALVKLRHVSRRSRPAAFHVARSFAYLCLSAFGKLDTQAAHDVMGAIDGRDDLLPIGEQVTVKISNTGCDLVVARVA